jgi:DNA-binding NarL/FixJ family response regulator
MVVDDDPAISAMYQNVINDELGLTCEHTYKSCTRALADVAYVSPDVILLDLTMPGVSGIECLKSLRQRGIWIPVLMLATEQDKELEFQCFCCGASGYLVKGLPPADLLKAIKEAYSGVAHMDAEMAKRVHNMFYPNGFQVLADRELDILHALCEGDDYKEIAMKLGMHQQSIRGYIYQIYRKLEKVASKKSPGVTASRAKIYGSAEKGKNILTQRA